MNIGTITKEEIATAYRQSTEELLDVIRSFNDGSFNQLPFEGSWTAGQVCEHLYKSVSNMPVFLTSETRETERDPLEKCEAIGSIFLNFDVKLQSPDFILPSEEPKQVDFFTTGFAKTANETTELIGRINLNKPYTSFSLPTIGELTGWEWIYFSSTHIIRHTRQLKNIREHL